MRTAVIEHDGVTATVHEVASPFPGRKPSITLCAPSGISRQTFEALVAMGEAAIRATTTRTYFCLKCQRRVDLENDIGSVELQGNQGAICGDDVDKMIAEIYVPRERTIYQQLPARYDAHTRKDWW